MTSKAAELRAQGKDVIGLGAGEPDFGTPEHIIAAGKQALDNGFTRYTQVDGLPSLKSAIIDKFNRDNGLSYEPEQILVSCGGKQSFFNLSLAYINPGDEVVIPAPYWVSYPDMVLVAGGVPVFIETDDAAQFKITPEQLDAAITDKTRLVVLNSPSNPSGKAYTRDELTALGEVLKKYPDVLIATDDMYEHILWNHTPFCNIVMATPELYDRTMVLNGVSKAYAMTGWRIGYAAGPADVIKAMKKIQSQSTSNPAAISQKAAEAALNGDQSCITDMLTHFKQRHDYLVAALNGLEGVSCIEGDGTFYAFPCVKALMETKGFDSDVDLASDILEKVNVALVPGSAFGTPGYMRLSFATSMEQLEAAIERLQKYIAE
ncbi:MAG: pyridoxal phosphate-dependent aminotransferase [Pseudomonadota bacterium]|nr:pyridoxal phosphate-dependent aminotransferase [Pseudomonadota bacterium]